MKNFKLPSLPANCFGLALGTAVEEFEGKSETFDRQTLWFRGKTGKPGRGYRDEDAQKVVKTSGDFLHSVVSDAAPGSAERIEAMKEFYAGGEIESAFDLTDEQISDRLAHTFIKMLKSDGERGLSAGRGKQELKRERRRTAE